MPHIRPFQLLLAACRLLPVTGLPGTASQVCRLRQSRLQEVAPHAAHRPAVCDCNEKLESAHVAFLAMHKQCKAPPE
jgi:hypothetical protein